MIHADIISTATKQIKNKESEVSKELGYCDHVRYGVLTLSCCTWISRASNIMTLWLLEEFRLPQEVV
jgi:hypothetical protein